MSDLVVTGASGFVGGSLAKAFAARGVSVTGLVRSAGAHAAEVVTTYQEDELARLLEVLNPRVLVHAAGSASVAQSIRDPAADFASQVLLFQRVLEGVRRSMTRPRVVFLSSAAVYGNPERLPVAETAAVRPISPYGHHKLIAEQLAREYSECFEIPTLVVRLFSLFGAAQRRLLLWELFEQFRTRSEVAIEGTGDEARDYLHVDDLADHLLRLFAAVEQPTLTVNVASGSSITVRELATEIASILHTNKPIVYRGRAMPGNPARWRADISLLERTIGRTAPRSFRERLARNIEEWLA